MKSFSSETFTRFAMECVAAIHTQQTALPALEIQKAELVKQLEDCTRDRNELQEIYNSIRPEWEKLRGALAEKILKLDAQLNRLNEISKATQL